MFFDSLFKSGICNLVRSYKTLDFTVVCRISQSKVTFDECWLFVFLPQNKELLPVHARILLLKKNSLLLKFCDDSVCITCHPTTSEHVIEGSRFTIQKVPPATNAWKIKTCNSMFLHMIVVIYYGSETLFWENNVCNIQGWRSNHGDTYQHQDGQA